MRFNDEEDRDSMSRFFVENKTALQAYAWQLTGDRRDAQDLMGDTAYKLAASWHKSRKKNLAYARKTMSNAWTDTLRHKGRQLKATPLESGMDKVAGGQEADRVAEVRARITAVMRSLSGRDREVFRMSSCLSSSRHHQRGAAPEAEEPCLRPSRNALAAPLP